MNLVFISPQFPDVYWQFCAALKRDGARVLGIGDTPYDGISPQLKEVLTEYYWLPSLEDYDAVFRAVAFFSYKYGKIDWLESNNEHWLSQDARLRDDFHIATGAGAELMRTWQSKAGMKPLYAAGGVPTARQVRLGALEEARAFAAQAGYPLFAKPEIGVGSGGAFAVPDEEALAHLVETHGATPYVLEEFVGGTICSYDAIVDSQGRVLFENQEEFPPSMADVAALQLDMWYVSRPDVDPKLQALGRAAVAGFGLKSRFVHMEFFRLTEDKPGLGGVGDYVGIEVNVRPPGGHTPEMMNYAHSVNVYQIWADMVCFDHSNVKPGDRSYYCAYASRRDIYTYAHSHEDVYARYGGRIVKSERMPDALSDDLGNFAYYARLDSMDEVDEFVAYVHAKA